MRMNLYIHWYNFYLFLRMIMFLRTSYSRSLSEDGGRSYGNNRRNIGGQSQSKLQN